MLLDVREPFVRHSSRFGSVLLLSLHADPTTTVGAPENGGVTVYVRELARALAAQGWDVDIVTRRQSPLDPEREPYAGGHVIRIDAGPAQPLPNDAIAPHLQQAFYAVQRLAGERGYRFISSHYWLSGVVGQRIADEFGIPHVHTPHSHGVERKQRDEVTRYRIEAECGLLQKAQIVTLSKAHIALYRRKYGVERPVHIVPAGVDTERFTPADRSSARRALGLSHETTWIGYIGRLTKEKGIDDLLHAFALLRMRNKDAGLFVVGGAAVRSRIPELALLTERLSISDAVRFLGPIPNERVALAFQAADVIAVPSHYEAFGLVALEARATGTPVVASDVGGLRELVSPENGGERVPPGDYIAWARALECTLDPQTLPERTRRAALANENGVHSWSVIASRITAIAFADAPVHA